MSYRQYFDIDPEYFPQVDKKIIDSQPDLWKKFYPHPSFVNLLKNTVDVLKRKQKLSVWVDGAYGTGKSHAVLTLKKLIEASEEDTNEYFNKYNLDKFLCKDLNAEKNSGKILVCHRYGSSDITSDTELIVALQEGIEAAMRENGIENTASTSLKNSLIRYFENRENSQSFDIYASGTYKDVLGGDKSEQILSKLKSYDDDALRALIVKIFKVPVIKGSFSMNTGELCDWIREIISKNNLKEIVFIWDEFSEYFENNMHHLTGFQQIAELSATAPFCLMIVTHKAEAYFSDSDPDKRKILDRFVPPIHISLPENIAFELMAQAMKVTEDPVLAEQWVKYKRSLNTRTNNSRAEVIRKINLTDKDLTNVLPIHPYAALILQHISIYYTSTARSMFNFIKNDDGDDVQAFQWFIDNFDFRSPNPFVTVDMLWSFFYEKGRDKLANGIKEVLNCYNSRLTKGLIEEEKRVLKVILLLQAISDQLVGNRDIFLPNKKNLNLAFEGTDLASKAAKIAEKLLNIDHVVSRIPLTGEVYSYCCKNTQGSVTPTAEQYNQAKAKTTKDMSFLPGTDLRSTIELSGAMKLRYSFAYATLSDIDSELRKANNPSEVNNKIYAIATLARDNSESSAIVKKIKKFFADNPSSDVVVVDSSKNTLSPSDYDDFVENYAMALAIGQSDINERKTYEGYATEILKNWAKRIRTGEFYVFSRYSPDGDRVVNSNDLLTKLMEINRCHYPECLEGFFTSVLNTMYDANSLAAGASCGIAEETKGTFRSGNDATKLEKALSNEWKKAEYWKTSHTYIANLKNDVVALIESEFQKSNRISISAIYNKLKAAPYGFMPCNLTAFVLGFILKEYAVGTYSNTDNLTTKPLDSDGLASMISDIIKQENTPDKRYKDKYIVTITKEERAFNKAASDIFGIPENQCVTITDTRSRIRAQMKSFAFPIWLIEYTIENESFETSREIVCSVIDNFCGIANNFNMDGNKSDNDIALTIGSICCENPKAVADVKRILTKDNCKKGMIEYLKVYRDGLLPTLAAKIGDGGQFINHLAYKFSSDAANWVWNKETVNAKIDELLIEYETIEISNTILIKNTSYADTIRSWIGKVGQIKLAYAVIKNYLGEEKELFEALYNLKRNNNILDSQKKPFWEMLSKHSDAFRAFFDEQGVWFYKTCKSNLEDLTEEDAKAILGDDKFAFGGSYTTEINAYTTKVQNAVKAYKSTLGHIKLKKRWSELTGTASPFEWSTKYRMPIILMVPDEEASTARKVFSIINSKSTDDRSIAEAETYLDQISYFGTLNDKKAQEKAFRDAFLSEYDVLFDDIEKVKDYLVDKVNDPPYYWFGNKELAAVIKKMASDAYAKSGYSKAKSIIDGMPADMLKEYLKQLIQDNVTIGLEIMKGKK